MDVDAAGGNTGSVLYENLKNSTGRFIDESIPKGGIGGGNSGKSTD
jgi:hypothetical protein